MVPLAGMEMGVVEIAEKALWWKKREHYGPAGEESKSMPGKYLYVPVTDMPVVQWTNENSSLWRKLPMG